MTLHEALKKIPTPDTAAKDSVRRQLNCLCKPIASLGKLEQHLVKIAGITGETSFDFTKKAVAVFCADNGVVAQNVTQSGQEVTALVAENLTRGQTSVCIMAGVAGADVFPVDMGIATPLNLPGLLDRKVAPGTRDMMMESAMSHEQAQQAILSGIALAEDLKNRGYSMAATGEMGIGNTTTSAAMAAVLLGVSPRLVTGRGAGLPLDALEHKIHVVERSIALRDPDPADPLDVLAKVGGLDIAGMAGFCLGGALYGLPVVLDGVISCVAALTACRLAPGTEEFLLPSHASAEPAGPLLLEEMGLSPLLEAGLHLGEGTGAVATFPLYDMMAAVYSGMPRFEDTPIAQYENYDDE